MRRDKKVQVEFKFMVRNYYRLGSGEHEVKGIKSLKLFESWFKLMTSRGRALYGVLKFIGTDETWIWQKKDRVYRSGWQRVK